MQIRNNLKSDSGMIKNKRQRDLEYIESRCREMDIRPTYQRLEIYLELAKAVDHPTAEMLYQRLKERFPTISPDTVYRTLAVFSLRGIIHKVETGESQARYEVVYKQHCHLICRRCQEIVDFNWPSMDSVMLPDQIKSWGKIDSRSVVVYGICGKCIKKRVT